MTSQEVIMIDARMKLVETSRRSVRPLSALAENMTWLHGDVDVGELCDDSRRIQPGDAFLCLPRSGEQADTFIHQAKDAGASAVISVGRQTLDVALPHLALPDMGTAGRLLRRWFGTEQTPVHMIGVTGTDGKTSVAWMLREAISRKFRSAWAVGTLGWVRDAGDFPDIGNTTPSMLTLHRLLAAAQDANVPAVICEVSSHGIAQQRTAGIPFRTAVWTNLGHDHLQAHGGFKAYAGIKQSFVHQVEANDGLVICNADDEEVHRRVPLSALKYGHGLYREGLTLGWEQELPGMLRLRYFKEGEADEVCIEDIPLGEFHAENLAAVALVLLAGKHAQLRELPGLLSGISAPPGRMQPMNIGRWQVFVDYAHTPEALESCLCAARKLTQARLMLVFGCGGERDREKRPQMGEIATRLADVVWLTSDNPRGELPAVIASEIEQGIPLPYPAKVNLQLNRGQAIAEAIHELQCGDLLVIAGKGHENYMEIADERHPWSDTDIAVQALRAKSDMTEFRACA